MRGKTVGSDAESRILLDIPVGTIGCRAKTGVLGILWKKLTATRLFSDILARVAMDS